MQRSLIPSMESVRLFLADLFFPRSCFGCGTPDAFLCDCCIASFPRRREYECLFCRRKTPAGETCLSCSKHHALDGFLSAVPFRENDTVAQAIHSLKYEFVSEIADPLGNLLATAAAGSELPLPDMIIPVPLHPWRYRFRGFNQSSLIARVMAPELAPPITISVREDILFRKRFTLPQARSRSATERKENLSGAFSLPKERSVRQELRGKIVWLVDDVATTGTTLEECAKVLKKAGAKKVFGVVVAG